MVKNLGYVHGFSLTRLWSVSQYNQWHITNGYIKNSISVYEMNKKRTKSRESAKKMIPRRPLKKIDSKSTCTHKKGFHSVTNNFFHSKMIMKTILSAVKIYKNELNGIFYAIHQKEEVK